MSIKSPSSPQFPLKNSWNNNNQININNQQQENFSAIWRHYERLINILFKIENKIIYKFLKFLKFSFDF